MTGEADVDARVDLHVVGDRVRDARVKKSQVSAPELHGGPTDVLNVNVDLLGQLVPERDRMDEIEAVAVIGGIAGDVELGHCAQGEVGRELCGKRKYEPALHLAIAQTLGGGG